MKTLRETILDVGDLMSSDLVMDELRSVDDYKSGADFINRYVPLIFGSCVWANNEPKTGNFIALTPSARNMNEYVRLQIVYNKKYYRIWAMRHPNRTSILCSKPVTGDSVATTSGTIFYKLTRKNPVFNDWIKSVTKYIDSL